MPCYLHSPSKSARRLRRQPNSSEIYSSRFVYRLLLCVFAVATKWERKKLECRVNSWRHRQSSKSRRMAHGHWMCKIILRKSMWSLLGEIAWDIECTCGWKENSNLLIHIRLRRLIYSHLYLSAFRASGVMSLFSKHKLVQRHKNTFKASIIEIGKYTSLHWSWSSKMQI